MDGSSCRTTPLWTPHRVSLKSSEAASWVQSRLVAVALHPQGPALSPPMTNQAHRTDCMPGTAVPQGPVTHRVRQEQQPSPSLSPLARRGHPAPSTSEGYTAHPRQYPSVPRLLVPKPILFQRAKFVSGYVTTFRLRENGKIEATAASPATQNINIYYSACQRGPA